MLAEYHFFYFFHIILHTYIHPSHSNNTFIHHHLSRSLSISSSLWDSVGKTSWGCRAQNWTRACLQPADTLPTELRITIDTVLAAKLIYTASYPSYAVLLPSYAHPNQKPTHYQQSYATLLPSSPLNKLRRILSKLRRALSNKATRTQTKLRRTLIILNKIGCVVDTDDNQKSGISPWDFVREIR